ncbi:dienelactone hydrolase family protein [Psychroserpens algicola]|uniref:Dienelactone hydrolase family protein n=1 Tax=Psychroserpens algicola TaxID=1719034 RepID=A0ABT0H7M6_9FLAO|nr:dienelactone hydrolase family protein [Psychroserpens algicola]MCK8480351.1 dienelactone hydrolase family protein [Psychroserpens algicola]
MITHSNFKSERLIKALQFVIAILISSTISAQDYTKQIDAFAQSFAEKHTNAIQPYLSDELMFGEIPTTNTPAIMKNIVTNLPKLNSMTIIKTENGKAYIAYDFETLGKRKSHIHFNTDGKIIKIELIENLIKMEQEARRQQQSVQLPNPGELGNKHQSETIEFPSQDGLIIHGNLYEVAKNKPVILLLHQAGYNRMEYTDIAPKLNELGYNCLAIDLRSGGRFAETPNYTNQNALEKGLEPKMIDAQQDIVAAVKYLNKRYDKKVIVFGSSYSSSLALLESVNNTKIKAVIGCSPGDYFQNDAPSLATVFSKIKTPYLVTSSKQEASTLSGLINGSKLHIHQYQFIPESDGFHGSKALWSGQKGADDYWKAVTEFLTNIK